jgi:hypothetical protein
MSDIEPMHEVLQPALAPEAEVIANVAAQYRREQQGRSRLGYASLIAGAAATAAIVLGGPHLQDQRIAQQMPFSEAAQHAVESIDDGLVGVGEVGFPAALLVIGGVKVGARHRKSWRAIDRLSSNDMNNGQVDENASSWRRAAAKVSLISVAGAGLGALTAGSVGTEITDGPGRPAEGLSKLVPGNEWAVQYLGTMPMTQSGIGQKMTSAIEQKANERGVRVHPFDLNLGVLDYKGKTLTDLVAGVEVPAGSPLKWEASQGCAVVPAMVDKAAGIPVGAELTANGVPIHVVAETTGMSAINRIGVVMDAKAEKACLKQDAEAPNHAITMETDHATAVGIVNEAKAEAGNQPIAVESKQEYLEDSKDFWRANVKPITNILALASVTMAGVSMAGAMGSRLIRNRSGWATKLANGVTVNQLRATELLRSVKEGVVTSALGAALTFPGTMLVNTLESGLKTGVGFREVMIASSIGIVGAVLGGASKLRKISKLINVQRDTRV